MSDRTCRRCALPFIPRTYHQAYCSAECRERWHVEARTDRLGLVGVAGADRPCETCGAVFTVTPNKPHQRCCSKTCYGRIRTAARSAQRLAEREAKREAARLQREAARRRRCEQCGSDFRYISANQRYCSAACRSAVVASSYRRAPRPCLQCDALFTPPQGNVRTCSAECRRRQNRDAGHRAKHKRRAQMAKAPTVEKVYRKRIFERDGYCCQLCGRNLAMGEIVPHPDAPTIDHIVPLSLGGEHTPANVQAAHFWCNSKKHTSAVGEQLRLIG